MIQRSLETYTSKNPLIKSLSKIFLKNVFCLLSSHGSKTILDVGCGEGDVGGYLMRRLNDDGRITGLDIDLSRILFAKANHAYASFVLGNVFSLPFNDGSFDLILATEILEHLGPYEKALEEIERVCSRYCLISIPYEPFFRMGNVLRGKHLKRWGKTPKHVNFWRKGQIAEILKRHFIILRFKVSFPWLIFLCEMRNGEDDR